MEFIWGTVIFSKKNLINLCKRRVILEGVNTFLENSISPLRVNCCVPKTSV